MEVLQFIAIIYLLVPQECPTTPWLWRGYPLKAAWLLMPTAWVEHATYWLRSRIV